MPKYSSNEYKLVGKDGSEIEPGDEVTSFRGTKTKFCFVSQLPGGGSNGKIIVSDTPDDPFSGREFYPSVFDAKILSAEAFNAES